MPFRAPTGQSDFAEVRRRGLTYVDKSHLITELIDDSSLVVLLPRPRRFGKTTNLSMLRYFFERDPKGEDRTDLFQDLAVWSSEAARAHFQRYPVIALTLKEIKPASWVECLADLSGLISSLFQEHVWLLDHPAITALDRTTFEAVARREADPTTLKRALLLLSELLHRATGERVVILIDEYDTPIHAGWLSGYYREVVDFFRVFLGAGLKDNGHLARGVLTGILRISKESIFSDMNHLAVYSLLRERFSTCFGFTEAEVAALAEQAGATQHLPLMRRWYNGYRFAGHTIYNPWSVLNFLASEDHEARAYWVNTSSNDLIGRLITAGDPQLTADLEVLLAGGKVRKPIDEGLVLTDLDQRTDAVWSLLLWSGYLKPAAIHQAGREVTLAVPNREVMLAYDTLLQRWMQRSTGGSAEVEILLRAMLKGDVELFEDGLQRLVIHALSFFDVGGRDPERVYHAFTLGLLVQLRATHKVESNRESGLGRRGPLPDGGSAEGRRGAVQPGGRSIWAAEPGERISFDSKNMCRRQFCPRPGRGGSGVGLGQRSGRRPRPGGRDRHNRPDARARGVWRRRDHRVGSALLADGRLLAWGSDGRLASGASGGLLGDGLGLDRQVPSAVPGLPALQALSAFRGHVLALDREGSIWGWGCNDQGQLGDESTIARATPVRAVCHGGFVAIAAGAEHSLFLYQLAAGHVFACGANDRGQLGDGTTERRLKPGWVPGLAGVTCVAAAAHSVVVSWGKVYTWGANSNGQLGDGTTTDRLSPTRTGVVSP